MPDKLQAPERLPDVGTQPGGSHGHQADMQAVAALFRGVLSARALAPWLKAATVREVVAGTTITHQFHRGAQVYVLLEGAVEHFIQLEQGRTALRVGTVQAACSPIGWSALMAPHRYATTCRARHDSRLLAWSMSEWQALCEREPRQGWRWLAQIAHRALPLLYDTLSLYRPVRETTRTVATADATAAQAPAQIPVHTSVQDTPADEGVHAAGHRAAKRQVLMAAGLFAEEDAAVVAGLVSAGSWRDVAPGEPIFSAGQVVDTWYVLARGGVGLSVANQGGAARSATASAPRWPVPHHYTVFTPGYCLAPPPERASATRCHGAQAVALSATRVLALPVAACVRLLAAHPHTGVRLMKQVLVQLSEALRSVRTQLVAASYDQDDVAVRTLLQQCVAQLRASSPLHAVPHLLTDRLTQGAALACLERVRKEGDGLEQSLATLSLGLLDGVVREQRFYSALTSIYDEIATAPPGVQPATLRHHCDAGFLHAFSRLPHVIQGEQHLPPPRADGMGHIFILNHLVSHPYHTLPNGFEFALDTHFVSAMVLFRHYGDGGLRVVRWSREDEFAHQDFYDRLGYLYVQTAESGQTDAESTERMRSAFFARAGEWLRGGGHLVICPEGRSHWAYQSPGAFRSGVFRLAASLDPEPWIVPIAVANFDKRLKHHALAAVIAPALRVSEHVMVDDEAAMQTFVAGLRETYRGHVRAARQCAGEAQPQG